LRKTASPALVFVLVAAFVLSMSGAAWSAPAPTISLSSVGSRYTGADIPIKGYIGYTDESQSKTIVVQRNINGTWTDQGSTSGHLLDGAYTGATQQVTTAGTVQFRTRLYFGSTLLATSNTIDVIVKQGTAPAPTVTGSISLYTVGSRYVGGTFTAKGYISGNNIGVSKDVVVQRLMPTGNWAETAHQHGITGQGTYGITGVPVPTTPGTYKYRTQMFYNGSLLLATSNEISVVVKALTIDPVPPPPSDLTDPNVKPAPVTEQRSVDGTKSCQTLTVAVSYQQRTNTWQWDSTTGKWVPLWSGWTTYQTTKRQATVADCVNLVQTVASDALLPDIQIKQLNKCGAGDLAATNNTCFKIVNPAPYVADFPQLNGKKLLKFPVLTMNSGDGPAEVIADRTGTDATAWKAYQTFYRPNGERQSQVAPNVRFYFAGDGHNHWHFTDFDDYWIKDLNGNTLRTAEKHGYCLLDNTTLTSMQGQSGVPAEPVYVEASTCGEGLPNALTILQGLSKGWGDTYPTSLPDQALDITGLPDGRYKVGVTADVVGAIREKNENNNTATMEISISGNTVTTYPATAVGGVN
jgi:hypothetical protein